MLAKVAKIITPEIARKLLGEWSFDRLSSWEPVLQLYLLLLYGKTIKGIKAIDGKDAVYRYNGQDIITPRSAIYALIEIFLLEIYEKEFKPSGVVVDVGAFVGMFSIKAAFSAKEVIAIEPTPETFKMLKSNCKNLPNIKLIQKALWSKAGIVKLYVLPGKQIVNSLARKMKKYVEVEAVTLDSLISKPVDFIKIDAEGAELEILEGAEKTLSYPGTKLAIAAYHHLPNGKPELPFVVSHLEARNYKVHIDKEHKFVYAEKQ